MPIRMNRLDDESREALLQMVQGSYLDGFCYEFAIALHRLTDWQLVGLDTIGLGLNCEHALRHAAVRTPEGLIHDARGPITPEEFGRPFGVKVPKIYDIKEADIYRVREVLDGGIRIATNLIETIWPDLPLCVEARRHRAERFATELEELCHRHGVWLRAPIEAVHGWPCLSFENDDLEQGYELTPSIDGNTYYINRYFR